MHTKFVELLELSLWTSVSKKKSNFGLPIIQLQLDPRKTWLKLRAGIA